MRPKGKYFVLKSMATGLVVEVPVPATDTYIPPRTPVYLWTQKSPEDDRDGQLWYLDTTTRTIRSRVNDYCLDIDDQERLMVNVYKAGSFTQQWELKEGGGMLGNHGRAGCVLDLVEDGGGRTAGSLLTVTKLDDTTQNTHKWNLSYQDTEYFYIKSKMHGKVLDVRRCDTSPGADVITFERNKTIDDNQLWYEDENGVLRSKLNDFAPEADKDTYIRMFPYDPVNPRQQWVVSGDMIRNRYNGSEVFDICGARKWNKTKIIAFKVNGQDNQRWIFDRMNV